MTVPGYRLDDRDLRILAVLQREGRITKAALGERVGLSASACWERVKALEAAGVVEGYEARIAPRALGMPTTVFLVVELESHRAGDFDRFERAVRRIPEVVECWAVGGGIDYLAKVVAPSVEAYQGLIDDLLAAEIGIARYFTYIVTKAVKQGPVPLALLAGDPAKK